MPSETSEGRDKYEKLFEEQVIDSVELQLKCSSAEQEEGQDEP